MGIHRRILREPEKPMKVLFITGSFPPMKCGVGDYTYILAKAMAGRENIQVSVITSKDTEGTSDSRPIVVPLMKQWSFSESSAVLRFLESWRPDVVHIQYPTLGYAKRLMPSFLPLLIHREGYKVVQTWHDPLSRKGLFRYIPNAIARDTLVVVESNYESKLPAFYRWFLRRKRHQFIPVGSNIPRVTVNETEQLHIRSKFDALENRLIAYFGFISPAKGIETLLEVADPNQDRIVLICDLHPTEKYHNNILQRLGNSDWSGKVFVTGFLPAEEVGKILCASDAAVFPFVDGLSMRNASVLAARMQGIFVLTTHKDRRGYDVGENMYYAGPGDVVEMRNALRHHAGTRISPGSGVPTDWNSIVDAHLRLYSELCEIPTGVSIR
jgi:glycosyltransferase involved in cell wall biosynthesis